MNYDKELSRINLTILDYLCCKAIYSQLTWKIQILSDDIDTESDSSDSYFEARTTSDGIVQGSSKIEEEEERIRLWKIFTS